MILGQFRDGKPLKRRLSANSRSLRVDSQKGLAQLDLDPLSICAQMKTIRIYDNKKLKSLGLGPLSACTALESLQIYDNGIKDLDLSPLDNHPALRTLYVGARNPIDLTPVGHLRGLRKLWIFCPRWQHCDLSPLAGLGLTELNISEGKFKALDLSPLATMTALTQLYLTDLDVKTLDLSPLEGLMRFRSLTIPNNSKAHIDLDPVARLPLTWFNVWKARRVTISDSIYPGSSIERLINNGRCEGKVKRL